MVFLGASDIEARDLTPQEQFVCASLRACIDIIERHDALEFDYDVLREEFQTYGLAGKAALFTVLEGKSAHPDIAKMISDLGSLTVRERDRVVKNWSLNRGDLYLPLLLDGHPQSRDLLIQSLGHTDPNVREGALNGLKVLPQTVKSLPIPDSLTEPLLLALQNDPIPQAAPYLARLNAAGREAEFAALLNSGEADIVTAAYGALYRNSPARAFQALMSEMTEIETSAQSRAIGDMLSKRHTERPDGFYLKFAKDMSGDMKLSVSARAAGLHMLLTTPDVELPELNSARIDAFKFLIRDQPLITQDVYLPVLEMKASKDDLGFIWQIAVSQKWINRDRISKLYAGASFQNNVIADLLKSDDLRSFLQGLRFSTSAHESLIQRAVGHPVIGISNAARQKLGLDPAQIQAVKCSINKYDLADIRAQMPFFDSGEMIAESGARLSISRNSLTTAHPTASGWLAGYDLGSEAARSPHIGGTILHYDNLTGTSEMIGDFQGPLAILPAKPLQLGQTTQMFWVVDIWRRDASGLSAYHLDLSAARPRITHIGVLPTKSQEFGVAPDGALLIMSENINQPPLRLSQSGRMDFACARPSPSPTSTATP